MVTLRIPALFFPTSVLLIDDNRQFIQNLSLQLNNEIISKIFVKPLSALEYLNNLEELQLETKYFISSDENGFSDKSSMDLNLSAIRGEVYNPARFTNVAVIVVDYAMPEINGIELCEKINNRSIKKIMLTGEADHHLAVAAFNAGIIDKFILKSDLNLQKNLNEYIIELQEKFFLEATASIQHVLRSEPSYALADAKMVEIFKKICHENQIVEYYLLDATGSFLLLDAVGKPSCFIIRNPFEAEMYCNFAEDSTVSPKTIAQIRSGEKIAYFPDMDRLHDSTATEWQDYLYPAQRIDGETPCYYTVISDLQRSDVLRQAIVSYNEYIHKVDNTKIAKIPQSV